MFFKGADVSKYFKITSLLYNENNKTGIISLNLPHIISLFGVHIQCENQSKHNTSLVDIFKLECLNLPHSLLTRKLKSKLSDTRLDNVVYIRIRFGSGFCIVGETVGTAQQSSPYFVDRIIGCITK